MNLLPGILAAIVALAASGAVYPQTFLVTDVSPDDNTLTLVSAVRTEYVYSVPENATLDCATGELLSAIMFNPYTPDDPSDDQILTLRSSGFSVRPPAADRTADEVMLMSNTGG